MGGAGAELPDGMWLVTQSRAGSRAGLQAGSQVEGQDAPDLPWAASRAGSQGVSQVAGRYDIHTYHTGSQVGGQGLERRGRRDLIDQPSVGDSIGPAHKQAQGGGGGWGDSMVTFTSRQCLNPLHLHCQPELAPDAEVVGGS